MSTLPQRTYDYTKYNLKINNLISFQKPVNSGEGETISKLYNGIEKIAIENQKIKKVINFKWIEKNRNSIASCLKLPQFITMNVIDGQAGRVRYYSLIFYSLTINNILNIVILLILAGISISTLTNTGIFQKAKDAKKASENAQKEEDRLISEYEKEIVKQDAEGIWDGKVNKPDLMSGMSAIYFDKKRWKSKW